MEKKNGNTRRVQSKTLVIYNKVVDNEITMARFLKI